MTLTQAIANANARRNADVLLDVAPRFAVVEYGRTLYVADTYSEACAALNVYVGAQVETI